MKSRQSIIFISILLAATPAQAQVGLVDRQGSAISIHDLRFNDEMGQSRPLDSYFHRDVPVLMALVYYRCPGVCTVVLNQLFSELQRSRLVPGKAFELVAISIDPDEKPPLAAEKESAYLRQYGFHSPAGFHFLSGEQSQISRVASELGFRYERASSGFAHPLAIFFLSPQGFITQTAANATMTLRGFQAALARASRGGSNTFFDSVVSYCGNRFGGESWVSRTLRRLRAWVNPSS